MDRDTKSETHYLCLYINANVEIVLIQNNFGYILA